MNLQQTRPCIGIDDMALYVPNLYLDIETLAQVRNLPYAKLNKGLGLQQMAIPDAHEDAATMSANAIMQLIDRNQLDPKCIGRIYLGTESALDGAKPTATYALEMLQQKYGAIYGPDCFKHCDVVDLTFACVGGVDALHNTLDWVGANTTRIGIVVCADNAKYELKSGGEYTQGAGAVAMLVKHQPRLLAIGPHWGVATKGVHDFFKPQRSYTKKQLIEELLTLTNSTMNADEVLKKLQDMPHTNGILTTPDENVVLHKDTPIFDGQFSNQCYQDRIFDAYQHFKQQAGAHAHIDKWSRIVCHLPYAYHAKRVFSKIWLHHKQSTGQWEALAQSNNLIQPQAIDYSSTMAFEKAERQFFRAITKTPDYKNFVQEKLEKAQRASSLVGNMYAAAIFLGLMSTLQADFDDGAAIAGTSFGFFGYGSGSKSKVFEATVQAQWKTVVQHFNTFTTLAQRRGISYEQYIALHTKSQKQSLETPVKGFALQEIGTIGVQEGARYYTSN